MQPTKNAAMVSIGKKFTVLAALLLAGGVISPLANSDGFDQNTALKLTQEGAILPLSDIVERLHHQHRLRGFKLLEATLHAGTPHPVYLLELMDDDHNIDDMCVDALTVQAIALRRCHVANNRPESD